MNAYSWYQTLLKPSWAPPSWVFGPVWTVLYILIGISFGYVLFLLFKREIPFQTALPFILNILFNLAFTPIQFGLQNDLLAGIDILFVLGTLLWALRVIAPIAPWVLLMNIPYFLWVCFATVLQFTITYMNW